MRQWKSSPAMQYGFAAGCIALAIAGRLLLDPVLGDEFPYTLCLLAILVSAWVGGLGPALFAVFLGGLLSDYFVLPPRGEFIVLGLDQQVGLGLYLLVGGGVASLGGAMRSGERRAPPKCPRSRG